jgi:hypothetical protein
MLVIAPLWPQANPPDAHRRDSKPRAAVVKLFWLSAMGVPAIGFSLDTVRSSNLDGYLQCA